jgi:hypothetical protein
MSKTITTSEKPLAPTNGGLEPSRPWERVPNEPAYWYKKFLVYRDMPHPRSIRGAFLYEQAYHAPGGKVRSFAGPEWYDNSKKFQWQDRADAWDIWQIEQRERDRTRERIEEQIHRKELREKLRMKVHDFLDASDPTQRDAMRDFPRLVEAGISLNEESRKEYGDNINKTQIEGNFTFAALVETVRKSAPEIREIYTPTTPVLPSGEDSGVVPAVLDAEYTDLPAPATTPDPGQITKKSKIIESPEAGSPQIPEKSENIQPPEHQRSGESEIIGGYSPSDTDTSEEAAQYLEELVRGYVPDYAEDNS